MPTTERLYIGGLDPPRLTVQDVLTRLQPAVRNQVKLLNVSQQSSCCHFDAISLQEDRSALEIVSKLYNNVTWKGCRLRVQVAKPHFLERLAGEIQDRQISIDDTGEQAAVVGESRPTGSIPRHLRVRRRYGQVSFRVDTKPCRVSDLPSFAKMRNKLLRKQQQKEDGKQQPRAHWNRAIHLRFPHVEELSDGGDLEEQRIASDMDERSTADNTSYSSTDYSSSASSSDTEEDKNTGRAENEGIYVWSDSSSSKEDEEAVGADRASKSGSEGSHQEEQSRPSAGTYQWSDDDDSSSSESTSHNGDVCLHPQPPDSREVANGKGSNEIVLDEFSPGIDAGDNLVEESVAESSSSNNDVTFRGTENCENIDLQQDVQSNINILASLFPELAGTEPCRLNDENDPKDNESDNAKSGWGAKGQMLRFDPSKRTADQFILEKSREVEQPSLNTSTGDHDGALAKLEKAGEAGGKEALDDEIQLQQEDQGIQPTTSKNNGVYEQGKLEEVFRQSREPVVFSSGNEKPSYGGGFSFGFQLDTPAPRALDESSAFSFSFHIPNSSEIKTAQTYPENVEDSMEEANEPPNPRKHRVGPFFPEEDIEYYVQHFFSLNDGNRIQNDLQGFRSDPGVEQDWDRQRRILTEDWKRKRKYAQKKRRKIV